MTTRAEDIADGVDRLLAAARLMLGTQPYATVEGAASILADARVLTALLAHESAPDVDAAVEVLRRRRGLDHVQRVDNRPGPVVSEESDPVGIITTAVGQIVRAGHTFDLLNGRDSSVLQIIEAARRIDRADDSDDSFQLATAVVAEFRRRGGVAELFRPPLGAPATGAQRGPGG